MYFKLFCFFLFISLAFSALNRDHVTRLLNGEYKNKGAYDDASGFYDCPEMQGILVHYLNQDNIPIRCHLTDYAGHYVGDWEDEKSPRKLGGDLYSHPPYTPIWIIRWRKSVSNPPNGMYQSRRSHSNARLDFSTCFRDNNIFTEEMAIKNRLAEAYWRTRLRTICAEYNSPYAPSVDVFLENIWKSNSNCAGKDLFAPDTNGCAAATLNAFKKAIRKWGYSDLCASRSSFRPALFGSRRVYSRRPESGDYLSIVSASTRRSGHAVTVACPGWNWDQTKYPQWHNDKNAFLWVVSGNVSPGGTIAVDTIRPQEYSTLFARNFGLPVNDPHSWGRYRKPRNKRVYVVSNKVLSASQPNKLNEYLSDNPNGSLNRFCVRKNNPRWATQHTIGQRNFERDNQEINRSLRATKPNVPACLFVPNDI